MTSLVWQRRRASAEASKTPPWEQASLIACPLRPTPSELLPLPTKPAVLPDSCDGPPQPHSVLGVYVHAKPILGKDLHELEGDFLLDPDLLAGSEQVGGGGGGGGGAGGGGGGSGVSRGGIFYGDDSGGSEVSLGVAHPRERFSPSSMLQLSK